MAKNGFATQAEVEAARTKPIQLADTAYIKRKPKSSAFDYPVEQVRQEARRQIHHRVAQGGLSVYTHHYVEAQKKAYEVLRAGLRNYDKTHSGWHSSYK